MDFSTILGIAAFGALFFAGVQTDQLSSSLVNTHGIVVVLGGCLVAMLINTPLRYLFKALLELKNMLVESDAANLQNIIPVMTETLSLLVH